MFNFTYDDKHLNWKDDHPYFCNRDYQLFNKKLRKRYEFKYIICHEYGSHTARPHGHGIYFFNAGIHDLDLDFIRSRWPYGTLWIEYPRSRGACVNYVTKYILKRQYAPEWKELEPPPYMLYSKNLGESFFTPEMIKYINNPNFDFVLRFDGYKYGVPKIFREKYFNEETKKRYENHCREYLLEMQQGFDDFVAKHNSGNLVSEQEINDFGECLKSQYTHEYIIERFGSPKNLHFKAESLE